MRRDAVEIASSELLNRRHMQGIEGIEGKAIDERFRGNMHGLAKDAVVLSLDRAGTQARQSMLHASLAPPPQVRQRQK